MIFLSWILKLFSMPEMIPSLSVYIALDINPPWRFQYLTRTCSKKISTSFNVSRSDSYVLHRWMWRVYWPRLLMIKALCIASFNSEVMIFLTTTDFSLLWASCFTRDSFFGKARVYTLTRWWFFKYKSEDILGSNAGFSTSSIPASTMSWYT